MLCLKKWAFNTKNAFCGFSQIQNGCRLKNKKRKTLFIMKFPTALFSECYESIKSFFPIWSTVMRHLDVPHSKSFFDWTVTLVQYAIANFIMNSVFLFSIFTREPFFIWEKPQKVFLGSNALFFNNDTYSILLQYIPQLIICIS